MNSDSFSLETRTGRFMTILCLIWIVYALVSCSQKIVDTGRAKLESYQKIKASTKFLVTVREDSCTTYTSKWNSNCWQCKDANVPSDWNVIQMKGNKFSIEPIK